MKTYVDYSRFAQEFGIDATLTIEEDGRFLYDESWSSYGGNTGGRARGIWWRDSDALYFRCDYTQGVMDLEWAEGQTMKAVDRAEGIDFDRGFTMSLRNEEPVRKVEPPKNEEVTNQGETQKKPLPTVARLHFKDGRILEKHLPQNSLFGLIGEMYYRLVDENGEETNVFEPRKNSRPAGSTTIEYDEI
jgi:hypothetical protein